MKTITRFLLLIIAALYFGCKPVAEKKAISIHWQNETGLDSFGFANIQCDELLDSKAEKLQLLISSIEKDAPLVYEISAGDFKHQRFSSVVIRLKANDSIWFNIETYSKNNSDTVRSGNFGGRTITKDESSIVSIRETVCRFLNK